MSSIAFPGITASSDTQMNAIARTGPVQNQTTSQSAPNPTEDTVKISASAQAQAMYQSGQSVTSIASSLGASVNIVDSYLGITAVSSQVVIAHAGGSAQKAAPAAAPAAASTASSAPAAAAPAPAKVDVKA
jgi:hypothetical protein